MKSLEDQIGGWCRHFNGVQNERCNVGVAYDDVRDPVRGVPCIKSHNCAEQCVSASFLTDEEIAVEAKRQKEVAATFLTELLGGKTCPHCHQEVKERRQVGRSIYVLPCWHRLGTGTLRETKGQTNE